MDQKLTDDLTKAAARWLSHALTQLNAEQRKTWDAVMAGHLDARLLIRFREGSLVLEAVERRAAAPAALPRAGAAAARLRCRANNAEAAMTAHNKDSLQQPQLAAAAPGASC
jgi:hypothetical protein